jgi:hypothetical protein
VYVIGSVQHGFHCSACSRNETLAVGGSAFCQTNKYFKMNRLLINMKNKVEIINGAIDMIYKLKKGETIRLNGLNTISVSLENNKDFDTNKRLSELFEERENLQVRINRMGG